MQTYSIRIAHTYLSIARIYAPGTYLEAVQSKPKLNHRHPIIYFQRTKEFNLLYPKGREDAGKAIWALLVHLTSGKALIPRLDFYRTYRRLPPREFGLGESRDELIIEKDPDERLDSQQKPPLGFKNGDNFCYMNSVFQALLATPKLVQLLGDDLRVDRESVLEWKPFGVDLAEQFILVATDVVPSTDMEIEKKEKLKEEKKELHEVVLDKLRVREVAFFVPVFTNFISTQLSVL